MKLKLFKNQKGQAFSTFQLLIAAVVALALLGVLMPIIGGINPGTDRLADSLKERINTQQDQPGTISLTDDIKVSSKGDPYVAIATITEGTGMSEGQVRFMLNGYQSDFKTSDGTVLEITAASSISYQFGVLCHRNLEKLTESLNAYESIIKENDLNDGFDDEDVRVCAIFPVRR